MTDRQPAPPAGPVCGDPPPDEVARLALAHLTGLGPARARWLLGGPATPEAVVRALAHGVVPDGLGPPPPGWTGDKLGQWRDELGRLDPVERWRQHRRFGLELLIPGHPAWPFDHDPEPPLVLWARGRLDLVGRRPAVAVVGSRQCSNIGSRVAHTLGRDLAGAGVAVVSGLASGIDAASHRGALERSADVVAVVGTGADVVYPRSSSRLWQQVAERGVIVGEAPLGTRGQRWRFPARNRLIAALSQVVVVVESHPSGGALHTVAEAERRQVPVLAVPGSVLNPASAGTNQLLFDGAGVAHDAADVLAALGISTAGTLPFAPTRPAERPRADPADVRQVLDQVAAGPVALDALLPDRPLGDVATLVQRLLSAGLVDLRGGMVALARP